MPDLFDPFGIGSFRRHGHIVLFIGKWLIRLLSASVEPFLRSNFGRRYVFKPYGAWFFFVFCAALNPYPVVTTTLFCLGLFALITYHCIQVFKRRRLSAAEPHSHSAGDSWKYWQNSGYRTPTIQCYLEPMLCVVVGLLAVRFDPFLGFWLLASGAALFMKEQHSRFKINRRIMDSHDAKIEAQALNNSLKQYQPGPGQGAQKPHRAYFPRNGQHPRP